MPDNQIDSSYFSFQTFFRIALSGAILLALGAFIPLFIGYYIQHEDPAYLWDWGGYFNMYQNFGNMIRHKEPWFSTLLTSIRNDDYNLFPISFLAPFSLVFQSSRFGYVCGISLCYLIPTAFISAFSLLSMMSYDKKHFHFPVTGTSFLCVFAFFLTFYPFWAPTLRGLPDIAGLIPLGLATLLLMRSHFLTTASWKTLVAFSVLVWLPFALRRWYAFSILAMLAVACILAAFSAFQSENRKKVLFHIARAYGLCGIAVGILLITFQNHLVFRILHTSYQEAYAGYHIAFLMQLQLLYTTTGPCYTALFWCGVFLAIKNKNIPILFCANTAILTFLLFSHTQALGIQHVLPIFFWAALVGGYPVLCLSRIVSVTGRSLLTATLLAYGLLASVIVFVPQADGRLQGVFPLFSKERIAPLYVEHMSEYTRLITRLKELTKDGDTFAVFASSAVLADSLLYEFDHSLEKNLVWASQVDARDHLNLKELRAALAIVTDPPVTHLAKGSQQVITLPNECIFHQHDFGTAYQQVAGPFSLAEGHKAYIYHRTRPLSDEDIQWIQEQLNHTYPTWKWNRAAGMIE